MAQQQTAAAPARPSNNVLQPFSAQQQAQSAYASAVLRGVQQDPHFAPGQRYEQIAQSGSFVPVYGQAYTLNLQPLPVGLITKYVLELVCTVTNPSAGSALTRTGFGPWQMLSNVTYTDSAQNQRINTYGWHLAAVNAMRRRRIPGSALSTDSPSGFGATLAPIAAPASIAAGASGTVRAFFEIPVATGRNSLKGAVLGNALLGTQQLQITFNPTFCQAGTDPLKSGYTGASASNPPTFACTFNLYQHYFDNYDPGLLVPLAPDLSIIYELKTTVFSSLVQGIENFFRYSPLREYWSTVLAFDNGGTMNPGTDITDFTLQAANQTTFWKRTPSMQSYIQRNTFGDDAPPGVYFFDTSDEPIITAADGNTVITLNPSSLQSGATVTVGWEDVAVAQVLSAAPSLAGMGGS